MPMMPPTIAVLTVLSPVWLAGLAAAVGLPVAAHLLSRTRYVPALFPGTRFVTQAVLETNRVDRPRHLLLLILRVLVLAFVAFAFARPQWSAGSVAAVPTGQGVAVVFVIDASASMQRTERGRSSLDQALAAVDEQIASLDPTTDTAAVILADRQPYMLLPEPTARFSLLRERLRAAACTEETADLAGAVALARAVLAEQGRAGKIVLVGDGQRGGFNAAALFEAADGVPLTEQRVGEASPANVSVRLVDETPFPPALAAEFSLTVELENHGREPRLEMLIAEGAGDRQTLQVELLPGAVTTQTLTLSPKSPGVAEFRVSLAAGDGFALDDVTGLVAEVAPARRVLLVSDAAGPVSADTAASRVQLALVPDADAAGPVRIDRVVTAETQAAELGGDAGACWVLVGATQWNGEALDALDRHLRAGGGVVWFADNEASRNALRSIEDAPLRWVTGEPGDATIAAVRFDHPALSVFEGPARAALVGSRLAAVAPAQPTEGAEVLLSAQDGRPIVASRPVGRGRLVVVNADLSPDNSGFASQPAFVALINELVRYAAPGPGLAPRLRPGDRLPSALIEAAALQTPDTRELDSGRAPATGAYLALNAAGVPVAGRWIELDPAESDSRQAPPLDSSSPSLATSAATAGGDIGGLGRDVADLWPYCIALALLLIGFESLALIGFARQEARA